MASWHIDISKADADGRLLARQRHHRAIIGAAAALMDEHGGTDFKVEQLAEPAGVQRRTIFNHFTTVDDVLIAVAAEILGDIIDRFERGMQDDPDRSAGMSDQVADALLATDLVEPMAYRHRPDSSDPGTDRGTGSRVDRRGHG